MRSGHNRLPQVRAIASEVYGSLDAHLSWTRLLLRFLSDRNVSLFSRMVRRDRNNRTLDDPVKPDVELLEAAASAQVR